MEKRGRKLVDYDSARNSYNALKESSKKVDRCFLYFILNGFSALWRFFLLILF